VNCNTKTDRQTDGQTDGRTSTDDARQDDGRLLSPSLIEFTDSRTRQQYGPRHDDDHNYSQLDSYCD